MRAFEELKARPIQKEYILLSQSGERLIGHRWFEDAAKDAGVKITWYSATRHTFASRLTMAGVDLRTIANLMEHSTIQMTMRYSHVAPEHQLTAVERLIALIATIATSTKTDTTDSEMGQQSGIVVQ